jgi:ubiquinone/menaquinone biosynthesis C-methylase UbiE
VPVVSLKRDRSLRIIFDDVAEIYDEVRPGYPKQVFEDVITISNIPKNGKILEICCGTGQATIPFAEHGYSIHCLEIGKNMVNIALKKFQKYPNIKIENIAFEDWTSPNNTYDLVLAATAFHWIPSEIGYPKTVAVLKDTGYLIQLLNLHPSPYTKFFERVQTIYDEIVPEWKKPQNAHSSADRIKFEENNIKNTGLFEKAIVKEYSWSTKFTAEQYIKLLNTFSDHRNLEENKRTLLFHKIYDLINEEYGGVITRPYLTVLFATKKSVPSR